MFTWVLWAAPANLPDPRQESLKPASTPGLWDAQVKTWTCSCHLKAGGAALQDRARSLRNRMLSRVDSVRILQTTHLVSQGTAAHLVRIREVWWVGEQCESRTHTRGRTGFSLHRRRHWRVSCDSPTEAMCILSSRHSAAGAPTPRWRFVESIHDITHVVTQLPAAVITIQNRPCCVLILGPGYLKYARMADSLESFVSFPHDQNGIQMK